MSKEVFYALNQYRNTYDDTSGDLNPVNYLECVNWLEGYMVGANMTDTPMARCINVLRGGYRLTDWLKQAERGK